MFLKFLKFTFTFILITIFQWFLTKNYIQIDLILLFVIYNAITYGSMIGQLSGFFLGFIQDFLNFDPLIQTLYLTCLGFFLGFLKRKIYLDNYYNPFLLVLGVFFTRIIFFYILGFLLFKDYQKDIVSLNKFSFSLEGICWILMNAILAYFIFQVYKKSYFSLFFKD